MVRDQLTVGLNESRNMQKTKVLIVDDDHAIRRFLRTSLQNQDTDKIEALDAGTDDYLTKPFSIGELTARLRVAMRHAQQEEPELIFVSDKLRVDLTAR